MPLSLFSFFLSPLSLLSLFPSLALSVIVDILQWWKLNSAKYPILSQKTCDILAISVSIVALELAFSTGGRVHDPQRTSLKPDMVYALVCARDWFSHDPTSDDDSYNDGNALNDLLDI